MIVLVIAVLLVIGAATVATLLLEPEHPTTALVVGLTIGLAQVNLAVLIAGALIGSLEPLVLLGATAACAALAVGLATVHSGVHELRTLVDRLGARFGTDDGHPTRAVAPDDDEPADLAGTSSVASRALEEPGEAPSPGGRLAGVRRAVLVAAFDHPIHLACVTVVVVLYAWQVTLALALPIVDYDGLALHAAAVAHWVTTGGFEPSGLSVTVDSAPLGPAAISTWAATFTGSLRWMFTTQLAFTALGAAAVADLARRFGATTADAVLAAALFAGVPVVALQSTSAYGDLGAACTLLAAWTLALSAHQRGLDAVGGSEWQQRQHRRERWRDLVLAGLALGLAAAARPANLAAVAITAVVVLVGSAIIARRDAETPKAVQLGRAAAALAALLVPVVVVAGYWYGRNWIDHGNPVHPFALGPFSGQGTVEALIVAPNRPEALDQVGGRLAQLAASWAADLSPGTYAVDQRLGGLGPAFLVAMVPGLLLFAARARRSAAIGVVAAAAALVLVLPAPWWSRATLFLPGVAAAALAAVLPPARGATRNVVLAAVVGLAAWGLWSTAATSTFTDATTHQRLDLGDAWSLIGEPDRAHRVLPHNGYVVLDGYPDGTVVAVVDGQIPVQRAPLYGRDLQRKVVILPRVADAQALASAMSDAGADVAVVSISASDLVEELRAEGSPLRIVAERGTSPARTVLVEPASPTEPGGP